MTIIQIGLGKRPQRVTSDERRATYGEVVKRTTRKLKRHESAPIGGYRTVLGRVAVQARQSAGIAAIDHPQPCPGVELTQRPPNLAGDTDASHTKFGVRQVCSKNTCQMDLT